MPLPVSAMTLARTISLLVIQMLLSVQAVYHDMIYHPPEACILYGRYTELSHESSGISGHSPHY